MSTNKPIVTGVLISLLSGSLGFGFSQIVVVQEVKGHTIEIKQLKDADRVLAENNKELREQLTRLLVQNQEFINLLRVQNELLMRKYP